MRSKALDYFTSDIYEIFNAQTKHPVVVRLLAFIVDYCILAIPVLTANFVDLSDKTVMMLGCGAFFSIDLTYFTLLNSRLCSGQTLGKRLFRIRVTDVNGDGLRIAKSLLRSLPIVLVMSFYPIMTIVIVDYEIFYVPVFYTLQALFFGTVFFTLVNRNRQALHDMLVGSQVTFKESQVKTKNSRNWKTISVFVMIMLGILMYQMILDPQIIF